MRTPTHQNREALFGFTKPINDSPGLVLSTQATRDEAQLSGEWIASDTTTRVKP